MSIATISAAAAAQQRIDRAREILNPSPVDLHHVPDWLRRRMLKRFGCRRRDTNGWSVLQHAAAQVGVNGCTMTGWLDHCGSTTWHGKPAFVGEPYQLSTSDVAEADRFANELGIDWHICSNSWWNPGATIRVVFVERDEPQGGTAP